MIMLADRSALAVDYCTLIREASWSKSKMVVEEPLRLTTGETGHMCEREAIWLFLREGGKYCRSYRTQMGATPSPAARLV